MFIVSSYDHLYAKDDKGKTALMYGTPNVIRVHLWGLISYITMRHHKLDLIQLAVPHTKLNVDFLIIYIFPSVFLSICTSKL